MVMSFYSTLRMIRTGIWNYVLHNGSINAVQGVHNMEELKYITAVYNETRVRALRTFVWDARVAPAYIRVWRITTWR